MMAPPTPPENLPFDKKLDKLREEQRNLEDAIIAQKESMDIACSPSSTNTCGRTSTAAPNPWLTADGQPCAGYSTFEALEGSFCAHWGSPVSIHATPCM